MRKEGLAAGTFRSFSKLDSVFRDMKSYVNMNVGAFALIRGVQGVEFGVESEKARETGESRAYPALEADVQEKSPGFASGLLSEPT